MNVRLAALSITLIAQASTAVAPVFAEEGGGGARFHYAPNIWRMEEPRVPKASYAVTPAHSALDGKVPHGTSFLGVDPQLLSRPAAPVAPVARTQATIRSAQTPATFRPSFGEPSTPPVMANLPKAAVPLSLPQNSITANKAVAAKLLPKPTLSADRKVHGTLLKHKRAVGQSAGPAWP